MFKINTFDKIGEIIHEMENWRKEMFRMKKRVRSH